MMKLLRWIVVPVAAVGGWYIALFTGVAMLSAFERAFTRSTHSPWAAAGERAIFLFSAGLAAMLVVSAAVLMAPAARTFVAWLACGVGAAAALHLARETRAWPEFATALTTGLAAAVFWTWREARKPAP